MFIYNDNNGNNDIYFKIQMTIITRLICLKIMVNICVFIIHVKLTYFVCIRV